MKFRIFPQYENGHANVYVGSHASGDQIFATAYRVNVRIDFMRGDRASGAQYGRLIVADKINFMMRREELVDLMQWYRRYRRELHVAVRDGFS